MNIDFGKCLFYLKMILKSLVWLSRVCYWMEVIYNIGVKIIGEDVSFLPFWERWSACGRLVIGIWSA
ncbi:hypothetical protein HMPREF9714_03142 [Myroides odoratimimus CCUG 12901]|uniref:Uncharacterized protein n=4 Tax=Myroides odoratimimus TaxID=76832 RepID=A0A0U2N2C6_9FLAO|nr:hypothetical protein MYRA21_0626 [Myroides sp. A21]ALU25101.1 hypothetical protein AS202_02530 [Myroides odoratimimus]APA91142.1 hypothetical protein BK054_02655 [Myroides sp. ZB35]EHO04976.1 hypothetical protein HMPREF9715_03573 [Myroides odoratimimus CIP 101113]EHO05735.1 hypothetical protein HMPREF9714_03142 [Myroides odoratimimus CCUG 12901]EHO07288.1 hypothetical protein HMPREF9712_02687 [Myroides odoratimimus CCUG 10230]EKB02516.1 hypothetical protein HMPREF9711_03301 [Myroides odora